MGLWRIEGARVLRQKAGNTKRLKEGWGASVLPSRRKLARDTAAESTAKARDLLTLPKTCNFIHRANRELKNCSGGGLW